MALGLQPINIIKSIKCLVNKMAEIPNLTLSNHSFCPTNNPKPKTYSLYNDLKQIKALIFYQLIYR